MQVERINYTQPLPDRVPNCSFSYSDHEAVASTFTVTKRKGPLLLPNRIAKLNALMECRKIFNDAVRRLLWYKILYLFLAAVLIALLIYSIVCKIPYLSYYHFVLPIIRMNLVITIVFFILTGTISNSLERSGLLNTKSNIEIAIEELCCDTLV